MITSKSNPQLKYLQTLLKKRSAREADRVFICEGRKMFFEILTQRPESLVKAYWSESGAAELAEAERALMLACDWEIVSDAAFCAVAETVTPQGVIAIVRMPEYSVGSMIAGGRTRLLLLESLRPGQSRHHPADRGGGRNERCCAFRGFGGRVQSEGCALDDGGDPAGSLLLRRGFSEDACEA